MNTHRSRAGVDRPERPRAVPWESLEQHSASAFASAGTALLVSSFVPIGLRDVTEWSWLAGIVLVGLGVVWVALGLLGLYWDRTTDSVAIWGLTVGFLAPAVFAS